MEPNSTIEGRLTVGLIERGHMQTLGSEDILKLESNGYLTTLKLNNGGCIVVARILKLWDKLLTPTGFFRVNRHTLINLLHVQRIDCGGKHGEVVLDYGERIPISRRRLKEAKTAFERWQQTHANTGMADAIMTNPAHRAIVSVRK